MVHSKILVLVLFAAWCGISWNWYVCGIKKQCGDEAVVTESPVVTMEAEEPLSETATGVLADEPAPEPSSAAPAQSIQPELSTQPASLDRVHIEQLEDHVLIHFPYNSTRKEDNADIDAYLSELARALLNSGGGVTITGHTDFVGSSADNKKIGLQRAQHIRGILTAKGVPAEKIKCRSMGETRPLATNDTPQGRYRNRRVEIRIQP